MRYQFLPEDFHVEEVIHLPRSQRGDYTLYRVRKLARTTLQVQAALAWALGRPRRSVRFPALKDRQSVAWQYAAVRGEGPEEISGRGWSARRVGCSRRPLRPGDLQGNRFTVVLRDLAQSQVGAFPDRLEQLARYGLPNYFGRQRFGSYSPGEEWVGKCILRRDAEGALRAHLSQPMVGDPQKVLAFKAHVRECWGDWAALFEVAPKPSNFRSVLVFLRDHPQDYRRALNLVTPRVLSLYLAAYQSMLWNRLVARILQRHLERVQSGLEIAGERLPLPKTLPKELLRRWRELRLALPHHRTRFTNSQLNDLLAEILAQEEMEQGDLKARLLKKAYLGPGERPMLLFPQEVEVLGSESDEHFPQRHCFRLRFFLPRGSYATLFLRALGGDLE